MRRKRWTIISFSVSLLLIFAFVPAFAQPEAPKTLKIGVVYEITGPMATTGERFGWGLKKGVEAINKDGGIHVKEFDKKIPIELLESDHATNAEKAVLQAEYLNGKGVVALIGTTSFCVGGPGVIEKHRLPTLMSHAAIETPFRLGYRYLFSNFPMFSDQGRTFIGFLDSLPKEQRPKSIALFEEMYDAGIEACKYAEQGAIASGYKAIRVKFQRLTKDMSAAILDAKKAGTEVAFALAITPDAMLLVKQAKELDYNPKAIFILLGATDRRAWATLGKDGDYVYSTNDFHWSVGWPGAKELNALYEAERKEKPYEGCGYGYASIRIVADAIQRAGSLDRKKIRDALAATDMMTVVGPMKFRANGLRELEYMNVTQYIKGVETMVFPEKWRERLPIYPTPKWNER